MTGSTTSPNLPALLDGVVRARPAGSPASLAVLEHELAGREMPPLHVDTEDEAYRVLEGRILVHVHDRQVRLAAGDSFVVAAGLAHTVEADSERARFLTMTFTSSPSSYEAFSRAVASTDAPAGPEDEPLVRGLGTAAGITVLGPPGALPAANVAAG
jgi:mannose-6-phosphate isomerase-like protein (cupin superfamily)